MKTNEIPEKIYVTEGMLFMTNPEITLPGNDNKIEYTRTDAFIDKAVKWLNAFLSSHYVMRYRDNCEPAHEWILEGFKKAMEE